MGPGVEVSLEEDLPHAQSRLVGLDLMRAVAILLVMAAHWSNNILFWFGVKPDVRVFFSGGLGVELFFALSGFLIGRILIEQAAADPGWRNLGVFLVRRWMRTLPLYLLVLAVLLVFFPPPEPVFRYALKFATLTQNLFKPMPPGWWYAVSWSLAVEEWFYLLFGCAVFLSFRTFKADWAIWPPIAVFVAVPLALRLLVPGYTNAPGGPGQMVFFRLDEIAYGVAMAQLHARRAKLFRHPLACLAVGLCLIAWVWSGHYRFPPPWGRAFIYNVTILGCVLLLPAALKLRSLPRGLQAAASTISAQSYALYLIHLTILERVAQALLFVRHWPLWACVGVAVIGPFALSYLSFRFFEAPILRRRPSHRLRPETGTGAERDVQPVRA